MNRNVVPRNPGRTPSRPRASAIRPPEIAGADAEPAQVLRSIAPGDPQRHRDAARRVRREFDRHAEGDRQREAAGDPGGGPARAGRLESEGERPQRRDRAGIVVLDRHEKGQQQPAERDARTARRAPAEGIDGGPEGGPRRFLSPLQADVVVAEEAKASEGEPPVAQKPVAGHDVAVRELAAHVLGGREQRVPVLEDVRDARRAHHGRRGQRGHAARQEDGDDESARQARRVRPEPGQQAREHRQEVCRRTDGQPERGGPRAEQGERQDRGGCPEAARALLGIAAAERGRERERGHEQDAEQDAGARAARSERNDQENPGAQGVGRNRRDEDPLARRRLRFEESARQQRPRGCASQTGLATRAREAPARGAARERQQHAPGQAQRSAQRIEADRGGEAGKLIRAGAVRQQRHRPTRGGQAEDGAGGRNERRPPSSMRAGHRIVYGRRGPFIRPG